MDDLQVEEVLQENHRSGKSVDHILNDFGILDTDSQLQIIADHLGTEVAQINESDITPEMLELIPATTARMYQCVPVADFGSTLRVALADPLNPGVIDELGFVVKKDIQIVIADRSQVEKLLGKLY